MSDRNSLIYLDNHATTAVDDRVLGAMQPLWQVDFANPHSVTHELGQRARDLVELARSQVAELLGALPGEIIFTSGATESNNLALKGVARRQGGGHIVTVTTEHPAVLAPVERLQQSGFRVTHLPVRSFGQVAAGTIDLDRLKDALQPDTFLVSIMLANNEIGAIQPLAEICRICNEHGGIRVHSDATQAIGKIPVRLDQLPIDLLSFSAHKIHGPKGVGVLFARQSGTRVRLQPELDGGGQESGRRGGTLNTSGIVGCARAIEIAVMEQAQVIAKMGALRDKFYQRLCELLGELPLNGPVLDRSDLRLANNLNCQFPGVDGHSLMINTPRVCASTGSACTATSTEPSHVLQALGLDADQVRCSLRFGLSKFTTTEEIEQAADAIAGSVRRLRHQFG